MPIIKTTLRGERIFNRALDLRGRGKYQEGVINHVRACYACPHCEWYALSLKYLIDFIGMNRVPKEYRDDVAKILKTLEPHRQS